MAAMHSLPLLQGRTDELSKCAFCPKLCRATCVVSEQQPREALTPWGKMTTAFDAQRTGEVDAERAELAWGCANCFHCREACDHRNPVADSLNDARADYVAHGQAPPRVKALLARLPSVQTRQREAVQALRQEPGVDATSDTALLLGCRYARTLVTEARAAIRLAVRLVGKVRLVEGCCGAWQRAAGAPRESEATRDGLVRELAGARRFLVFDPRCALELSALSPLTLVELAARHLDRFAPSGRPAPRLRYHDSCALGRGLGLYEPPRRLLEQALGEPALELEQTRAFSRCSGAGGILPVSMPEVATGAAQRLIAVHERSGGGTLVTSCASSLSLLRARGASAVDLISVLESALENDD